MKSNLKAIILHQIKGIEIEEIQNIKHMNIEIKRLWYHHAQISWGLNVTSVRFQGYWSTIFLILLVVIYFLTVHTKLRPPDQLTQQLVSHCRLLTFLPGFDTKGSPGVRDSQIIMLDSLLLLVSSQTDSLNLVGNVMSFSVDLVFVCFLCAF